MKQIITTWLVFFGLLAIGALIGVEFKAAFMAAIVCMWGSIIFRGGEDE